MSREFLIWTALGAISTILVLLAGWYFFIRDQEGTLTRISQGRGFTDELPEGAGVGSTSFNLFGIFSESITRGATTTPTRTAAPPRLWQVSVVPATGLMYNDDRLYYVEQPTGHAFSANPATGDVQRLTSTLLPRVTGAVWVGTSTLITQQAPSTEELLYFAGRIEAATSTSGGVLVGEYLPKDVFMVTPAGESSFVYGVRAGALAAFIERTFEGTEKRIWTSPVTHWIFRPYQSGYVVIEPASSLVRGSAFFFSGGILGAIVENIYGLMVSRDGELFSETKGGKSIIFTVEDGKRNDLPLATFAEKCIRAPTETKIYCAIPTTTPGKDDFVDAWYRGEVHTSDRFFVLDIETNVSELVLSPEGEYGVPIDASDMSISPDGLYLAFIDTMTDTPWTLRVRE